MVLLQVLILILSILKKKKKKSAEYCTMSSFPKLYIMYFTDL